MQAQTEEQPQARSRLRVQIQGGVQGVGFRPFVHRLANELKLAGFIRNDEQGITLEVEGSPALVRSFLVRLPREKPPLSFFASFQPSWLPPVGYESFQILTSITSGRKTALVMPDIATCPECLEEIFDPNNRRFEYPFTNCTQCGPRFSIIAGLPYDRQNTAMARFSMCNLCRAEYENPQDRRFHAEPNACPVCGPHLDLWDAVGTSLLPNSVAEFSNAANRRTVKLAAERVRDGAILALKGIGGFQLITNARDELVIERLRRVKQREEKPFALMFASLEQVKGHCELSPLEERLLAGPEAPIVLLQRKANDRAESLAAGIAPGNPRLGVMLAYSPLHHLLLAQLNGPVVATSGNLRDEPICIDEHEAVNRLHGIADLFLVHNRPILRHVDDSIVQVVLDREMLLRRARGYAPLPIELKQQTNPTGKSVLGVGGHLKNSVALSAGPLVFISQHIGDLETDRSLDAFHQVIRELERFYEVGPQVIAADLHPDYLSTKYAHSRSRAAGSSCELKPVQHHLAHVYACMAENEISGSALGVAWDGTGFGTDGTIWGGEFFRMQGGGGKRVAHLRPFPLPGSEEAVREPRRSALGGLYEVFGEQAFERMPASFRTAFSSGEMVILKAMLRRKFQCVATSSAGRLFDLVAAILDLRQRVSFEGQAAMAVEFASEGTRESEAYSVELRPGENSAPAVLDWAGIVRGILADIDAGVSVMRICARFHNSLANAILQVARHFSIPRVVLTGGCFQNRQLLVKTVEGLRAAGFEPFWHQRVPSNDGGISLGQVVAARSENG